MKNKQIEKEEINRRTKAKKGKKKKMKLWKKIVLIILILLIAGAGWFVYKTHKNGGGLSGMLATAVGHDENTKKNLPEIKVLLLGVSTDLDSKLTDTIMVASYNPNTQKANLLSIPRDTFTGKNAKKATHSQKINAIYNVYRDPQKTLDAVNEITGLDIKHYALIETEALIELVDAIGGVEFNVPRDMNYDDPTQDLHIHLQEGLQMIDGEKAEQLLRYRHDNNGASYSYEYGDNDLGRMRTQRDFITATLKQTLKPSNIFKIGQILEIANKNLTTNIELSLAKDYIPYAVEFNTDNIQTAVLPGTTPSLKETNNVSIFVHDKVETQKLIQSMFYSDVETSTENENNTSSNTVSSANNNKNNTSTTNSTSLEKTNSEIKIELLNGSGNTAKLQEAKELLTNAGFNVTKTGKTSTISKTIITNKKDTSNEKLNEIKKVLGVGSISTNKLSSSQVDLTIVIGKDF